MERDGHTYWQTPVGESKGYVTDLCHPGLPRQPTQGPSAADVIGLLQQRPTDHLSLEWKKGESASDQE